jgi:hypothetical protein
MERQELQEVWIQMIQKAWSDTAFKNRLLANPKDVFKENGVDIPDGQEINIVENTVKLSHFVLPRPPDGELSESDLKAVAGGFLNSTWVNTFNTTWK